MRAPTAFVLLLLLGLLTACEDGTDPSPDPGPEPIEGTVDVSFDAAFEQTDSSIVVDGETLFDFPNIDRALRLERYHHFDFGGTMFESGTRYSEFWRLMLIHQHAEITRNDSTILSYVDHGNASIEGSTMEKFTDDPGVSPGDPLGFDSFVMYMQTSFGRIVWLGGEETRHGDELYHEDLAAGREIEIATTGASGVPATSGSFRLASVASLVAVENGEPIGFERDSPPVLNTGESLVLEFDDPLDAERGYIYMYPMFGAPAGARRAFMQPRDAAHRIVIPASVLAALVENVDGEPVPYRITVHEYWTDDGALAGTAHGEAYALPLFQISETSLEVWIQS